ncbi:MAG: peptidoglycan DD-metalloendopeptidase family protein [Cyclobacteriaceae bacterium]|nr:peptidoglycan DD-metalloendopeptidase family protein [Cyclobacteriaceae bacterium]
MIWIKRSGIFLSLIVATIVSVYLINDNFFYSPLPESVEIETIDFDSVYVEPERLYGFNIDSFEVAEEEIQKNQSLSDILLAHNISHQSIFTLASRSKSVFDVRKIQPGAKYTLFCEGDSLHTLQYMIYEENPLEYVVFNFKDSLGVEKVERDIEIVEKKLSGKITHSLSVTMDELNAPQALTNKFVDIFAWQLDFFRLIKNDWFTIIYDEKQIDGKSVGIGDIKAIYFNHYDNDFWAFKYDQGEGDDYFDEEGNSLRKALLKYPLEFTRISSRYTLNRFHPVQKRWKAHLGTDLVAAPGTPIRTVGDGIVLEAKYSQYNGNYVKVRHNATYTTQYLHMSKIASGIKAGMKVKQGQLIGYVGSTGLATGPHLCYRFWRNGVQVDALKVELPPSNPILEENKNDYAETIRGYIDELQKPIQEKVLSKF